LFGQHANEGVQPGILRVDLAQVSVDQFHWGNAAVAHHLGHDEKGRAERHVEFPAYLRQ
jgi:hypothetical protein